jgi:hypothetical protein
MHVCNVAHPAQWRKTSVFSTFIPLCVYLSVCLSVCICLYLSKPLGQFSFFLFLRIWLSITQTLNSPSLSSSFQRAAKAASLGDDRRCDRRVNRHFCRFQKKKKKKKGRNNRHNNDALLEEEEEEEKGAQ